MLRVAGGDVARAWASAACTRVGNLVHTEHSRCLCFQTPQLGQRSLVCGSPKGAGCNRAACQESRVTNFEKGSVESTHKVPTSHYWYHTKHCHAVVAPLGGLTHRRGFSRIRPPTNFAVSVLQPDLGITPAHRRGNATFSQLFVWLCAAGAEREKFTFNPPVREREAIGARRSGAMRFRTILVHTFALHARTTRSVWPTSSAIGGLEAKGTRAQGRR